MTDIREPEHNESHEEDVVDYLDDADEVIPFTYSITSYGADYPVDSLIKRLRSGDITVPTFDWDSTEDTEVVGFQREYVWPKPKADKFIESLLLGLPVPGVFLIKEKTGRFLVLDGHQRLYTLRAYYDGVINGREYRLGNVQDRFTNKRYNDLDVEDRRRIDDSIIHATVVKQDEPTDDQSSIYIIFERLNTGGVNLQPQEIRVALYHGKLAKILRALSDEVTWRSLYGKKSRRLKDMEMILRFFAFFYYLSNYRRPMKDFLNRYMASNRDLERQTEADLRGVFYKTTEMLDSVIGKKAFRPKGPVNAAVVDSLMNGIAKRLDRGEITDHGELRRRYEALMSDQEYISAIETGTSQEGNVETRMRLAQAAFADVK